jgi:hypothetical protein
MTTTPIPKFGTPFIMEELAKDIREGKIEVIFTTVDTGENDNIRTFAVTYIVKKDLE